MAEIEKSLSALLKELHRQRATLVCAWKDRENIFDLLAKIKALDVRIAALSERLISGVSGEDPK